MVTQHLLINRMPSGAITVFGCVCLSVRKISQELVVILPSYSPDIIRGSISRTDFFWWGIAQMPPIARTKGICLPVISTTSCQIAFKLSI